MIALAALLLAAPPVAVPCEARFGPRQSFSGVWLDEFEGQYFFSGSKSRGDLIADARRVWIDVDLDDAFHRGFVRPAMGHAYRVTFTGEPPTGFGPAGCVTPHIRSGYIRNVRLATWEDLGPAR